MQRTQMLQGDFLECWQGEEAKREQLFVNKGIGDHIASVSDFGTFYYIID